MGEWWLKQQARRYEMARTERLEEILKNDLFEEGGGQKTEIFVASPKGAILNFKPGDLLLASFHETGDIFLSYRSKDIGQFLDADKARLSEINEKLQAGGLMEVRFLENDPLTSEYKVYKKID